jgi:molybdenum cofactor biosynthesis protein MoaC
MVSIGEKIPTSRSAHAQCIMSLPIEIATLFDQHKQEIYAAKGTPRHMDTQLDTHKTTKTEAKQQTTYNIQIEHHQQNSMSRSISNIDSISRNYECIWHLMLLVFVCLSFCIGPVFCTAIIAGTQAVKKTSDLLPFCHPLAIEGCDFTIELMESTSNDSTCMLRIDCIVRCFGKTGVEMEALTGAMTAALTIYDMCKAISHEMIIQDCRLIEKQGGKTGKVNQQQYKH